LHITKLESLDEDAALYWDKFYSYNQNKFFKDRKWLRIEFPELFKPRQDPLKIFEIGCGAGNTMFPFLEEAGTSDVFAYACDYSSVAISVVQSSPFYNTDKCKAFVYDITSTDLPDEIQPESLDICIAVFVLSALNPDSWAQAALNIFRLLRPGGLLLIRDYARYDMTQLRFKKNRLLDENFYARGDGTRVYYFSNQEISDIFCKFDRLQNETDRRLLVNRQKKITMYRCWIQAKFVKPLKL